MNTPFFSPTERLKCPSCALRLGWTEISFDTGFRCPGCEADLRMPSWFSRAVVWGGMALSIIVGYFLGLPFDSLVIFTCTTFLLFGVVLSILLRHHCPITLQLDDSVPMDLRGVRNRHH
jgi:hypothetical protein